MGLISWPLVNALCAPLVIIIRLMVWDTNLSGLEERAIVIPDPFSEWNRARP
jgi:hypothetical protein